MLRDGAAPWFIAGAAAATAGALLWSRRSSSAGLEVDAVESFRTICGRGLLGELKDILAPPFVIVTMRDLWELESIRKQFPESPEAAGFMVYFVETLEQDQLDKAVEELRPKVKGGVIGLGGGQALDVAKYIAWRLTTSLVQVPTALTVGAAWGHRAAVRRDGVVRYVGFAEPVAVYIDFDVLRSAPDKLNLSGVGDVLCYHTAHADWALAEKHGKCANYPYDAAMVAQAKGVLDRLLERSDDVRELNDRGIRALVTALQYGGAAFHQHGWNPRPVEGFDHMFFVRREKSQGVCVGRVIGWVDTCLVLALRMQVVFVFVALLANAAIGSAIHRRLVSQ